MCSNRILARLLILGRCLELKLGRQENPFLESTWLCPPTPTQHEPLATAAVGGPPEQRHRDRPGAMKAAHMMGAAAWSHGRQCPT